MLNDSKFLTSKRYAHLSQQPPSFFQSQHRFNQICVSRNACDSFRPMVDLRPERRFLRTYFGTFVLVLVTVYAPYIWLSLTESGNDLLKWWLALPGLPSFFLLRLGLSMEHCRSISFCLASLLPV